MNLFGQIESHNRNSENLNHDYIIPNTNPPENYFEIEEGSCGEACLFTVFKIQEKAVSQKEINVSGGNPGRGLHGSELFLALNNNDIKYKNISLTIIRDYSEYLNKVIIPAILNDNPVLLGVKIYPDEHPEWSSDHFILLIGYNSITDEIIYNSNDERDRIPARKLLNKKRGYSIVDKYKDIFAIQFADSTDGRLFSPDEYQKYKARCSEQLESGSDTIIYRRYDKKGRIWSDGYFLDDEFLFSRGYFYHKNGNLWTEVIYKERKPYTVLSNYDSNGNPVEKGTLINGNGSRYIYDEEGNLRKIIEYRNGKKRNLNNQSQ